MSDRLSEIEALVGFLGSSTITNGSQAHVALSDLVKFAREVESVTRSDLRATLAMARIEVLVNDMTGVYDPRPE